MADLIQPDGQVSYSEFLKGIEGYNCGEALAAIGQVSRAFEFGDEAVASSRFRGLFPGSVDQWQLAFLAKSIIMSSSDFATRKMTDEAIIAASKLYNSMRDPRIGNPTVEMTDDDLVRFMVRTSHEQFTLQGGLYLYEIARAFILFEEIAALPTADGFSINDEFKRLTGLTVREFLSLGIIYWSAAGKPIRTPLPNDRQTLREILQPENQEKFLAMVSIDYAGFRQAQSKEEKRAGYEKFEFNSLKRFPLIRSPRYDRLLCPVTPYLLRRFTRGIYYLLLDAFNQGAKRNPFASHFGKYVFEPYVGRQLRQYLPEGCVFEEPATGRSEKGCDWIVETDELILLVECKATALTARAKAFADMDQIAGDLRKRIAPGIAACERTKAAIDAKRGDLVRFEGKPTLNLIVIYDEVYLFNGRPFREIIDQELSRMGVPNANYQVCTILELEYALPALQRIGFGRFWASKLGEAGRNDNGLMRSIQRMVGSGDIPEPHKNRLLELKCAELFDALLPPSGRSVADP